MNPLPVWIPTEDDTYSRAPKYGFADKGISIIVSSHILYEIEALTETILLIHQGRILADGTISDIRELIDEHPAQSLPKHRRTPPLGARSASPLTIS